MFNWLRELLEIKHEFREKKLHCLSCDTLREQLTLKNYECEQLMKQVLRPPEIPKTEPVKEMIPPKMIPWNVRRQMLEREDREKARLMREAPKPDTQSVEDLEKELDIASAEREAEASSQSGGTKPAIG